MFLIAGPCVIESEQLQMETAGYLKALTVELGIPFIFKSSFDKANRTSHNSFRGPGLDAGLAILEKVRGILDVPVLTDVHDASHVEEVACVVDVLQTPAFLCRQTDFISAVARAGKPVNFKKGQFLSPKEMSSVIEKANHAAWDQGFEDPTFMACERGTTFGYNDLVVDMRSLVRMKQDIPYVVFDATHSVQSPGGNGTSSGGEGYLAPYLACAAAAVGVNGIFIETHPNPSKAMSDGPNSIPLHQMREVLQRVWAVASAAR